MKKITVILISLIFFMSCNEKSSIIGNTIKINGLEIAEYDLPKNLNWFDANQKAIELGDGWRLPDWEELDTIIQHKTEIPNIKFNEIYWSSFSCNENQAHYHIVKDFNYYDLIDNRCYNKGNLFYVRLVRGKLPELNLYK